MNDGAYDIMEARLGDRLAVNCSAGAEAIRWWRWSPRNAVVDVDGDGDDGGGDDDDAGARPLRSAQVDDGGSLVFSFISKEDEGFYRCSAIRAPHLNESSALDSGGRQQPEPRVQGQFVYVAVRGTLQLFYLFR